ncbi:MAG TPA: metallophosphoesterase family protein [Usitatibacter sp.]|jgi:diadenosine tetraphosphatase ApaH/serine/threonine PP2A family protein phosphatase|nr:metallophosphoesterase family protein [Usitatibacter sp.]
MIALLADVHANLEALEACLAHARALGARRFALLGDLVGYGADPGAVVDAAAALARDGAIVIKGNHDEAVERAPAYLNDMAQAAILWTRDALSDTQKAFLAALPLCVRDDTRCYVHGSADRPSRWTYVDGPTAAAHSMAAAAVPYTLCGHVHDQRLYFEAPGGRVSAFRPHAGTAIPLPVHRRWLAIAGSVGQPRDGDTSAAYALLEEARITFHRVRYDHAAAAQKVRRAGLPAILAYRIEHGV